MNIEEKMRFDVGYDIGKSAFKAGLKAIPAHDPILMGEIERYSAENRPIGYSLPLLDGWIKGWTHENLISDW
jgi:hypothetical protein